MIACKENLIYFEQLAKKQGELYADSCDFGVIIDNATHVNARKNILELVEFYGSKMTKWSTGSRTEICIPVESDYPLMYSCIILTVSFNQLRGMKYLTIQTTRQMLSTTETVSRYNSKLWR